jgi:uncharacterized membrane protein
MSKNLTKSKKPTKQSTQVVAQQSHYSGPIPQPEDLQNYEDIQKGFAERIMSMAENESIHRQEIELKIINSEKNLNLFGQLFATIMGLSVIALMGYAFSKGYAEQVMYIGFGISSVVGLFIYKNKQ